MAVEGKPVRRVIALPEKEPQPHLPDYPPEPEPERPQAPAPAKAP